MLKIRHRIPQQDTQDGDGVKIRRVADFRAALLDPFLMVDELRSDDSKDYIGGFPPHPHRGIETFTYIRKGGFEHRDHLGNRETIREFGTQWMSTGSGVLHSEMPLADATKGMHGFQIWVNMAAKDKFRAPIYQDSNTIANPLVTDAAGNSLRALAGEWRFNRQTISAPITDLSASARLADVQVLPGQNVELGSFEQGMLGLLVYEGEIAEGEHKNVFLLLEPGSSVSFSASSLGAKVLVFVGEPLKEPVIHYGPFVMNTEQQIHDALRDYQAGAFGRIE